MGAKLPVETAHRVCVWNRRIGGRPCLECQTGSHPSWDGASVERVDFDGIRRDEVVIAGRPVEFDDEGIRRHRHSGDYETVLVIPWQCEKDGAIACAHRDVGRS
jgi:hypothetical protein